MHFLSCGARTYSGTGHLIDEVFRSHSDTPHPAGLLWTRGRSVAETSSGHHTTFSLDRHPCPPMGFETVMQASERPQTALRPRSHWDRLTHLFNCCKCQYGHLYGWR